MLTQEIAISPDWSAHTKHLFYYILRYLDDPVYVYNEADWQEFCRFYSFDFSLIAPYISRDFTDGLTLLTYKGKVIVEDNPEFFCKHGIDPSQFLCHPKGKPVFFQNVVVDMFRCIFVRKDLDEIQMNDSLDSLRENIQIYRDIAHHIAMLNSTICTRECLEKDCYRTDYIPQIAGVRNVQAVEKILQGIMLRYDEKKNTLLSLYHAYRYSTLRTLDMLILTLGLQIIKFSPFFDEDDRTFCDNLLHTLMMLLRNAQVIAIFKNDAYFDKELAWMNRGSKDHTTRLQILYEYGNGDQYSLRLDLPHKGIPFFHLNSQSKGEVKCFPLDENAYQALVKENPSYEGLFIEYDNGLYFLKENAKKLITKPEPGYENLAAVLKGNEHFSVHHQLAEAEILDILAAWCELLSSVAASIPYSEKIDPVQYYRLSKVYSFAEICCYADSENGDEREKVLRSNILLFLGNTQILNEEEVSSYADINSMEILSYAIEKLKISEVE